MEIGHNVMHGQWDWMNDPEIHSSTWDWDTASTAEAWKHSHNYIHHTYTNILGKDTRPRLRDHADRPAAEVASGLPRCSRSTTWCWRRLFEWGVPSHDLDFEAIRNGEKSKEQLRASSRACAQGREQIDKDYSRGR